MIGYIFLEDGAFASFIMGIFHPWTFDPLIFHHLVEFRFLHTTPQMGTALLELNYAYLKIQTGR